MQSVCKGTTTETTEACNRTSTCARRKLDEETTNLHDDLDLRNFVCCIVGSAAVGHAAPTPFGVYERIHTLRFRSEAALECILALLVRE